MDPKAEEQTTPETMESNVTESVATDTANVETEAIQIEEVKPEETTSTEVATDSTKESVKTIEAEEDHEEPKEQKLSIPDFDQLSIEDSLAVIKSHINEFTPVRIKGIVENGRSAILHELNKEQASVKEVILLKEVTSLTSILSSHCVKNWELSMVHIEMDYVITTPN